MHTRQLLKSLYISYVIIGNLFWSEEKTHICQGKKDRISEQAVDQDLTVPVSTLDETHANQYLLFMKHMLISIYP